MTDSLRSPQDRFRRGSRRWRILAVVAAGAIGCCGTTDASDANEVLQQWLNQQTNLHTWSAEVIQTRSFKTLAQPLVSTGQVWYSRPAQFRWELGRPPLSLAVRHHDELLVIYPRLKRAERYALGASGPGGAGPWRELLSLLDAGFPERVEDLERRFRVTRRSMAGDVLHLTLEPRSGAVRKWMPSLRLEIRTTDLALRATELRFADGSVLR
ncbi:MAG TPA: outer membrane lipoprotein carrier protein LolA, partial [Methylomirabilota bacterium]|nr:outer membrane lipoprotein carrier protein LolA [Methylomirabilota bacterium]